MKVSFYDETIGLKLTELGRERLKTIYNQLRHHPTMLVTLAPFKYPDEDEEGYSQWSLKDIISTFGGLDFHGVKGGMILGRYFDRTIKIIGEENVVDSKGSSSDS